MSGWTGKAHIAVVVGIPYYTEISNIVSVVLALRLALLQRGTRALIVVVCACLHHGTLPHTKFTMPLICLAAARRVLPVGHG